MKNGIVSFLFSVVMFVAAVVSTTFILVSHMDVVLSFIDRSKEKLCSVIAASKKSSV